MLSLQAINADGVAWLSIFKPSTFVPILALIGIYLFAFQKKAKRKDTGMILLGFAILMFGMDMMSGAVEGLKNVPEFREALVMFSNPILGVIVGTVFTAIIQSSSASVGVLQALTATGSVTYATAIPVIMGQNIGTCVSAMISSVGTSKNARRAAIIHLAFNIIATVIILPLFYLLDNFINFEFMAVPTDYVGIAVVHTGFKLVAIAIIAPFSKYLENLSNLLVRENKVTDESQLLDERFFTVPAVALDRSTKVAISMAEMSVNSILDSFTLLEKYDETKAENLRVIEGKVDYFEDKLGSYLVKLSSHSMTEADSRESNKLLHVIGDFERISDHAINIVESAEEMTDKNVIFSPAATKGLNTLIDAVKEILGLSLKAFKENDIEAAKKVEPLEQVIDDLRDELKKQHIERLQRQECTIELGFMLSDLLTNLERISDHCSNVAGCILEIAHNELDIHEYLKRVKSGDQEEFNNLFAFYQEKYSLTE